MVLKTIGGRVRSAISAVPKCLFGISIFAFGWFVAVVIADTVQRYRGSASDDSEVVVLRPALSMVRAHWTDPKIWEAARTLVVEHTRMELFWFTVVYIAVQPFIRAYFGNGKHYQEHRLGWKKVMWSYNWVMAAFSLCTFATSLYSVLSVHPMSENCDALFNLPIFDWTAWAFYASKYVEYLDTFWLLLMNSPVTWLQYLHHIGAPYNMWTLYRSHGEPVWVFVCFNSFIHTIMYVYYAYAVRKISILPKQLITTMQILQFVIGFVILWEYRLIPCFHQDPIRIVGTFYFSYFYVGLVLALFLNFFIMNYIFRKPKSKAVASAGAGASASAAAPKVQEDKDKSQ